MKTRKDKNMVTEHLGMPVCYKNGNLYAKTPTGHLLPLSSISKESRRAAIREQEKHFPNMKKRQHGN